MERDCKKCLLKGNCAHSYIFETQRSEKVKASDELSEYPHPFTIEPPITFGLILIGKVIDYLPYFVFVYQELSRRGIEKATGRYTLKKVESVLEGIKTIYDAKDRTPFNNFQIRTFADIMRDNENWSPLTVWFEFLTLHPYQTQWQAHQSYRLPNPYEESYQEDYAALRTPLAAPGAVLIKTAVPNQARRLCGQDEFWRRPR